MNAMIFASPITVRALAEGRKTQTRRISDGFMVYLPEPVYSDPMPGERPVCAARGHYSAKIHAAGAVSITVDTDVTGGNARPVKPFELGVKPGEFHFIVPQLGSDAIKAATLLATQERPVGSRWRIVPPPGKTLWVRESLELDDTHAGAGDRAVYAGDRTPCPYLTHWPWKKQRLSPLFLPFDMRRFELALGIIKLEKLQAISEEDAKAEGVQIPDAATAKQDTVDVASVDPTGTQPYRRAFACLWESLHGAGAWAANPWVNVFTFAVNDRTKAQA